MKQAQLIEYQVNKIITGVLLKRNKLVINKKNHTFY